MKKIITAAVAALLVIYSTNTCSGSHIREDASPVAFGHMTSADFFARL